MSMDVPGTAPVGVIGLGIMGSAMGARLIASGRQVWGFDIDARRNAEFCETGGSIASSATGVADHCRIVITSLTSAPALESALDSVGGSSVIRTEGLTIIETSTLSLSDKLNARTRALAFGADLLDCPISGTGRQARAGDAVAYLSGGEDTSRASARAVLAGACREVLDVGPFGNGTRMKLIANLLVAVHNAAAAEALILAKRAGIDLAAALEALTSGAGTSRMLEVRGPMMVAESFDEPTMRVSTFGKDVSLIRDFAGEVGAPTPLFAAAAALYDLAGTQGRDDQDTASVFAVLDGLEQPSGELAALLADE